MVDWAGEMQNRGGGRREVEWQVGSPRRKKNWKMAKAGGGLALEGTGPTDKKPHGLEAEKSRR